MTKYFSLIVMTSATLLLAAASTPVQALDLSGTLGGLGNTLGKVTDTVGKTVNGVTGNVANTTTKLGAFNKSGALSADAKSDILKGVMAKARVLSPQELARLCLATGGGDKGCGSGNKPRILGLIDARLDVLSNKRLVSVCTSVGAGCGGSSSIARIGSEPVIGAIGAENVPGSSVPDASGRNNSLPNGARQMVGRMSDPEVVAYKKRCVNVLQSPQRYESDIVSLCRLIKRQRV